MRTKVASQRYSIPGFPCLYISNCIYTAWKELRSPDLNTVHAVRFCNKKDIQYIDLTNEGYFHKANSQNVSFQDGTTPYLLLAWPLIACCSVRVRSPYDSFKPEYIIPQFILQWLKNNGGFEAIKFSSTHINRNELHHDGDFFNLVFPVKTRSSDGYCMDLQSIFDMTEVMPAKISQIGHSGTSATISIGLEINKQVRGMELTKGYPRAYWATAFGSLEADLMGMKSYPIEFSNKSEWVG
jgi:hypothetical protein